MPLLDIGFFSPRRSEYRKSICFVLESIDISLLNERCIDMTFLSSTWQRRSILLPMKDGQGEKIVDGMCEWISMVLLRLAIPVVNRHSSNIVRLLLFVVQPEIWSGLSLAEMHFERIFWDKSVLRKFFPQSDYSDLTNNDFDHSKRPSFDREYSQFCSVNPLFFG